MGEYAEEQLEREMGYAWGKVQRADPLPAKHGTRWTHTEEQLLQHCVNRATPWDETARRLGRTVRSCQMKAEELGLFNPNQPTKVVNSKEISVNHMHLITLLQEGYTTCRVSFPEKGTYSRDEEKTYTYKIPKDAGIAVGDRVVVYGGKELKVARVTEVHDEPQIDFKAPYALKWVVQRVDLTQYEEHAVREAAALDHLTRVQRKKEQEQLLKELFGDAEGLAALKKMING